MIFNSLTFLLFLSFVLVLYWHLPRRARLLLLFSSSLLFYGFWDFRFLPLLLLSVVVDYSAGLWLGRLPDGGRRRAVMLCAVAVNLSLLFFFKYLIFFAGQLQGLASLTGLLDPDRFSVGLHIILPLGISFYTFQSMSYTIDVWRRVTDAQRDFALFATYVIFFPQLIAGPILRAGEVIWQLDRRPDFDWGDFTTGLLRVGSGLFLKCVLADNLAPLVDEGFGRDPSSLGALDVTTLSFLFGFQIYFDFAGYSHIAIGSARMMGIRFPENFNFPYLAASPRDFWKRWHISLGSWIRDYLYLPLCGVPGGTASQQGLGGANLSGSHPMRRLAALWGAWVLMGLWHGAQWTFAVWGLWHAAAVSLQRGAAALALPRIPRLVAWGTTLVVGMLGWVPFRAESLPDALALWGRLITVEAWMRPAEMAGSIPVWLSLSRDSYYVAAAVMLSIPLSAWVRSRLTEWAETRPDLVPWAEAVLCAIAAPLVLLFLRPVEQFIYFQF